MNRNSIEERYQDICDQISTLSRQFHRGDNDVCLLPVSKTFPVADIRKLLELGCFRFGENYVQEACAKVDELNDEQIEWHFIGPLQSNKTRDIAQRFHWVQTLDRLKIAQRLNDQRPDDLPPLNVCIQVNISLDPNKAGIPLDEVSEFARHLQQLSRLKLRGLMAIPARDLAADELKSQFSQMRSALDRLKEIDSACDTLSMGMSGDMAEAIEAGSTMVRVGSAIFGERTQKQLS